MITLVEPRTHVTTVWGKQRIGEQDTYRLMRYVLRVDHDDKVLLHNVVTGHLVVLEPDEAEKISRLPSSYANWMQPLVENRFFVSESCDEHQQVVNLRRILRQLTEGQAEKGVITQYSILPTTACNARCYYCYEQGIKPMVMSEQTADKIIQFIVEHCDKDRRVTIQWFGGEPTLGSARIDQICEGLRDKDVSFASTMISNGYLFDDEMVKKAKNLWNLTGIQISIDGTEKLTNRIKAFQVKDENPYGRIIQNVGRLIQNEIHVGLRMNFDLNNEPDFVPLLMQVKALYGESEFLEVYAYPVIGEFKCPDGVICHGTDTWFDETMLRLNDQARQLGMKKAKDALPVLAFRGCAAQRDSYIAIMPNGDLVKCIEQLSGSKVVGSLDAGIVNRRLVESWKRFADNKKCWECSFFPECIKPQDCSGRDRCLNSDRHYEFMQAIKNVCNDKKGMVSNGFRRT